MRRLLLTVGLAVAGLGVLTACSGVPADPIAAARDLPDAPAWVVPPSGTDCGTAELQGADPLPAAALRCLRTASDRGDEATFAWTAVTTEGDPVPTFRRTTAAGVSIASTGARDSSGASGWSESACTGGLTSVTRSGCGG